tara:strand:- start:803 stop:1243 length:441 start_codon:yes stop_codon:yes gene_type:complete
MIIDIIWLAFLTGLLVYFFSVRLKAKRALKWHKTTAYITVCDWRYEGRIIWPKVQYSYYVDGREYKGENLFMDTSHNTPHSRYARNVAYKVAKAYKNNEALMIYYHPDKPDVSAIDVEVPTKINVILLFISGLILLHLGVLVFRFF